MSATGKRIKFVPALGVDQRWITDIGSAEDITPARVDPDGLGWRFDRGLEPWWDPGSSFSIAGNASTINRYTSEIDSCFVWAKQNTEQVYYLIEQAGTLYYFWGNKGAAGSTYFNDLQVIDTDRHIPSVNEPGTQYIPFGNRLLIINGYDEPLWFYGRTKSRNFGFTFNTGEPQAIDIVTGYLAGDALTTGIAAPTFSETSHYGLGQIDERNHYTWKISFITDTGSESPLSNYTVVDWMPGSDAAEDKKFGAFLSDLPIGPKGTVARRIYRTKNQKLATATGAADSVYYFVRQINENCSENFIDVVPDGSLVDEAPSQVDSVTISGGYQYGAAWNGHMWLGGGTPHPTRLIYSKPGLPEQFGGFDYFELGNTAGGAITQIFPYYNNLLIFRQRAIDMVRITSQGFSVSQLSPEVGTEASNTVRLVPGYGVCFLSRTGLYAISGGTEGGSKVSVTKLSNGAGKEMERLNSAAIQRATAVYSHKEQEYWCHYPVDGMNHNTRGIVLHTQTGQFSFRHGSSTSDESFWFTSMTADPEGNIIIGPRPNWTLAGFPSIPTLAGASAILPGVLHVWCGSTRWGARWSTASFSDEVASFNVSDNSVPAAVWESSWINFGDTSTKHRVFSVEVEIVSQGNTELQLQWAQDYDYLFNSAGDQIQNRPETVLTTSEDPVMGPSNTGAKNFYTIGESMLQDGRMTTLRWDVNTKLVQNFKFKLTSVDGNPFHIVRFHIDFSDRSQKALNQLARNGSGQPR
jgi:hypothetical protein